MHPPHANEYEMIESWISHQKERVQDLQNSMSRHRDASKRELLKEIILEQFKEDPNNLETGFIILELIWPVDLIWLLRFGLMIIIH